MNIVMLMGRLTREPDIRYTTGENPTSVARFTLAVDRRGRKTDGIPSADFISCIAFGKSAEFAEKYLRQGTKIAIRGRLQSGSYTNKDGQKVYTTDVVAEEIEFAESKKAEPDAGIPDPRRAAVTAPTNDFANVDDDIEADIPFA